MISMGSEMCIRDRLSKVDISITTNGGGIMGQTDAIRTAIARGLVHYNGGAEGVDEELRDEYPVSYTHLTLPTKA